MGLITWASHPAVTGGARQAGDRSSNTDLELHLRHRRPPRSVHSTRATSCRTPSSDYYGGSAPCHTPRATVALPAGLLAAGRVGRARQGSHVHCVTVGGGGVQLCSGSIAASTPQAFLAASRTGIHGRPGSRLPVNPFGVHCSPAHIRQVGAGSTITEVQPLVHSRYTFPPRSPGPDHLAVLDRPGFVRAASHPPQRLLAQAALNFNPAAATIRRCRSLTSIREHDTSWRTLTTWKASSTATASGSSSRIALA